MNKYTVPEGWKLVPVKPTMKMRRKADLSRGADYYTVSKIWDAMLAAAPEPTCSEPVVDNDSLINSAKALLDLDSRGALNSGIGGHARTIISAFIERMSDNTRCESECAESERQPEREEGDIFDRVQEVIAAVYDREMQIEDAAREVIDLCDGTITAKQEASHD